MSARTPKLDAYPAYLILEGGWSLGFSLIATVNLVWQAEVVGLNPLQLVLVGTLLEATCFLGEVPTGVAADLYSRRLSIVIGVVMTGAGFFLEGAVPRFEAVLLAQVIWGLGATFLSGATQAWISDEIGDAAAGHAFLRAAQVRQICTLAAVPLSVALASLRLNVPILVGASLMLVLGAYLALAMPETGFCPKPRQHQAPWHSMTSIVREGGSAVRASPLLLTLLLVAAFVGMASEGLDRLSTVHILDDLGLPALGGLDPVTWFGVIRGGALVLGIAGTQAVRRWVNTSDGPVVARALFASDALRVVGVVLFGLTQNFYVGIAAAWGVSVLRTVNQPIYMAWLNQRLESSTRATVLSMSGQMDALGQIAGGPLVGAVGTVSIRAAIVLTGLVLTPALWLYVRASRQLAQTPHPASSVERLGAPTA
ncbi:MAG TPA: MFS transporter [Chloroflexota bacterium]|nr:MFS transporter [Chloroflexota bacterium]